MSYAAELSSKANKADQARGLNLIPEMMSIVVLAAALISPLVIADGDSWWHLTAGQWIMAHGEIPHADPFSYTMAGAPWTAHEWLAEIFLALAFRAAGWSGVVILTGMAAALAALILLRRIARHLDGIPLFIVSLFSLGLLAPGLLARPHILALPCLVVWAVGLVAARDEDRAPSLLLLPLMVLWANLHGGFALGIALVGPFALEALMLATPERRPVVFKQWFTFGLLALLAALVTPHGLEGLLFPFKLLGLKSLAMIGEWRPTDFAQLETFELALLGLIGLALSRPLRVAPLRLLLLLGVLHLALSHVRHQSILGVMAPLLLAGPIAKALANGRMAAPAQYRFRSYASTALVSLAALMIVMRLSVPVVRSDNQSTPMTALASLPEPLRSQRVLNSYDFGGYLISLGIRPYIDGRTDLYGDTMMERYSAITQPSPDALDAVIAEHGIAWTVFHPNQTVVKLLDRLPGWRRLHTDRFAVVHVRTSALPN